MNIENLTFCTSEWDIIPTTEHVGVTGKNNSMDFFETVKTRRSIRRFENRSVPSEVILKAFNAAILAPNSSNIQAWNFYWVRTPEKKKS